MEDVTLTPLVISWQDGKCDNTAAHTGLVCSRYDTDWNTN